MRRLGLQAEDDQEGDPLIGQSEVLATLYAASVTGRAAFGLALAARLQPSGATRMHAGMTNRFAIMPRDLLAKRRPGVP
jgi:hypothetical protein